MISIQPQLSIFLDNRPGTLARMCQALAKAGVNIQALSISDTVDHAVVRMVVSDAKQALSLITQLHETVHERQVVVLDVPNRPGELAQIAERLAHAGINIEYAYCTSAHGTEAGTMVLRTNDLEATIDALS